MLQVFAFLGFAFVVLCPYVAGETGCPPEEDILPCKCSSYPQPGLVCRGRLGVNVISRVFEASKRYTYNEVRFEDSMLFYLPLEIFEKTTITSLYLKDSEISIITPRPNLEVPHLRRVRLENTFFFRGLFAQNFTLFTSLEEIFVKSSYVMGIPSKDENSLPKSIKYLTFSETEIGKIDSGAFANLPNLVKLVVESNPLSQLTRDIFPRPSNVIVLDFNNNKITSIPDDLFSDMPFLQSLNLENNQISTINEASFTGRESNVANLRLEGNPLVCDCGLQWIIKDKPAFLGGSCAYPTELKGRKLEDLNPSEISC